MSEFLYWPYDEVELIKHEKNALEVKTPWISAKVTYRDEDKEKIDQLADKVFEGSLGASDMNLVHWFFSELDHYPLCYIVPTPKTASASNFNYDLHALKDRSLLEAKFEDFLGVTVDHAERSGETDFQKSDALTILSRQSKRDWSWDAEAALTFAQLDGLIHPESLFSVIRRFHLLDVVEKDTGKDKFALVETLKGDDFARAASILVRQNHYVTQKCQEALLPALKTAGRARHHVEDFIKEEKGHDLILGVAMKALAHDPESVPVSLETKGIMHLLKYAGERNLLAFALAVDFFERSSYEDTDPLAQLLIKGGFEKAARQINRHMEINDAGGHENVAASFLEAMAPCTPDYAWEAVRIAETISMFMNRITSSALELYESQQEKK